MRRLDILMVFLLCWSSARCLQTTEVSLKSRKNNEFRLDLTIGSKIRRFRLVKKNENVPTMVAEENGVLSNLQSQVGKSQTFFNPDIAQLNVV